MVQTGRSWSQSTSPVAGGKTHVPTDETKLATYLDATLKNTGLQVRLSCLRTWLQWNF